ncbi:hypothetical protein E2C01_003046 [Portunus trituberculatus]|uniref:Uncharacterized protein n=1 Tax=Portunus trituberculatus TaxID=210409 RepID=A0A5B7CL46_PORTR|nr:hypothetical protein [Portunus trituberculatus]
MAIPLVSQSADQASRPLDPSDLAETDPGEKGGATGGGRRAAGASGTILGRWGPQTQVRAQVKVEAQVWACQEVVTHGVLGEVVTRPRQVPVSRIWGGVVVVVAVQRQGRQHGKQGWQ